jgi:hypothetical protein
LVSTLEPDLDNANEGNHIEIKGDALFWCTPFSFYPQEFLQLIFRTMLIKTKEVLTN